LKIGSIQQNQRYADQNQQYEKHYYPRSFQNKLVLLWGVFRVSHFVYAKIRKRHSFQAAQTIINAILILYVRSNNSWY
jgi:hypothetical protein